MKKDKEPAVKDEPVITEETTETSVMVQTEAPMGFEDEDATDLIIPRIKVVQSLSPERKEKLAEEGEIINSLTLEKLAGKKFIPVFKFSSNIEWIDRNAGGGIACQARDGKNAITNSGEVRLCLSCKRNLFDNTKQGRDAIPTCTKYINFFGFIEDQQVPIILSFAKTNYNEGKKLYSLAKVSMQNMWNHGYTLIAKLIKKNNNEWFIIDVLPAGPTTVEERDYGMNLFKSFKAADLVFDDDYNGSTAEDIVPDSNLAPESEF